MDAKVLGVLLVVLVACIISLAPAVALAAPGGKIAAAIFKTFWGKVLFVALTILLLPLILYIGFREYMAERRSLKDLRRLGQYSPAFDWLEIKDRITDCFYRVHSAWRREDLEQASEWMTHWFWQNQQITYLDWWEEQGFVNHCQVKSLRRVKPLFVACRNIAGDMSGSRVVVSIKAKMEDYLAERDTGKVVEGEKGYKQVETIWTFILQEGKWRVANIEEDAMSLAYARLVNEVPAVLPLRHPPASVSR